MSNDKETQANELLALEAIYDEEEFKADRGEKNVTGKFTGHVNVPGGFWVKCQTDNSSSSEPEKHEISYLPPMTLYFQLPDNYPSECPPSYTLFCSWLTRGQIFSIGKQMDNLWKENKGLEILFTWTQFLKEEVLDFLNIAEGLDLTPIHSSLQSRQEWKKCWQDRTRTNLRGGTGRENGLCKSRDNGNLDAATKRPHSETDNGSSPIGGASNAGANARRRAEALQCEHPLTAVLNYNRARCKKAFESEFFSCRICFGDKQGRHCVLFEPCSHVFCQSCVKMYLEVNIRDGSVHSLKCPEEKCNTIVLPSQVRELVDAELFSRYDSVLLSSSLDTMGDIVYCPRPSCQLPVVKDPGENMARCAECLYVFCIHCRMGYHGVEPCRFKTEEKKKLLEAYASASAEQKSVMEQRYGKKQLEKLLDNFRSEEWIESNSKNCPHCGSPIEKSDGCNKMVCGHCNTFFCWLCGVRLNAQTPYLHFNNPASACYNKLFQGVRVDDFDNEWEFEMFLRN